MAQEKKIDKRIGNQFWKLRSKHGRDKLFATPELLWEAASEYFDWCEQNPIVEIDYRGKDAIPVELYKKRPFTLHGLCLYFGASTNYWKEHRKAATSDFLAVVTHIEEIIYNQKFTGAAIGIFNANIIARDLGLTDKSDITSQGEKLPGAVVIDWSNVAGNKTDTETT